MESGAPETAAETPATELAEASPAIVPSDVEQSETPAKRAAETITPSLGVEPQIAPGVTMEDASVAEWSVLAMSGEQGHHASPVQADAPAEAAPTEVAAVAQQAPETFHDTPDESAEAPLLSEQVSDTCETRAEDAVAADLVAESSRASAIERADPDGMRAPLSPTETTVEPSPGDIPRTLQHIDPLAAASEPSLEPELQPARTGSSSTTELPAASVPESEKDVAEAKGPDGLTEPSPASAEVEHQHAAPPPQVAEPWTDIARLAARRVLRYAAYGLAGYLALTVVLVFVYRFINPPMSTLMVYESIAGAGAEQDWVPIEKISPHLIRAVVVAEDGRFCDHNGIDLAAMRYAIMRARSGIPVGASTISMQVTKNLFLWPSRSFIRKLIEIPLTLLMELIWPKSRILEVYLNIAEWAPGVFGAEAAARHHFSKPASALGEREAARLAAALPNPIVRDAGQPGPRLVRRAGMIQNRVRLSGDVTFCVRQGR